VEEKAGKGRGGEVREGEREGRGGRVEPPGDVISPNTLSR